jgi:hypothetical protein
MIPIKIHCPCGQKYAFNVEPVNGRMNGAVQCPACGADGTEAANAQLALALGAAAGPASVPAAGVLPPPLPQQWREGESLPPPGHPSLRGDMGTYATNPARIKVDWGRVPVTSPSALVFPLVLALASVLAALRIEPKLGLIMMAATLWLAYREYREIVLRFFTGNLCPTVVIREEPCLLASYSDLSMGDGPTRPAVRIWSAPLRKLSGEPPRLGTRLAAPALYLQPTKEGFWSGFDPDIPHRVTGDPAEIRRIRDSIPEEEWRALDECLAAIPDRKEGLYRLWGPRAGQPEKVTLWPLWLVGIWLGGLFVFGVVYGGPGHPPLWKLGSKGPAVTAPAAGRPSIPSLPARDPSRFPSRPAMPNAPMPNREAAIAVGTKVEAQWGGTWRPGVVVSSQGPLVRVRFEDAGRPSEMMLPADRVRLRQ